MSRPCNRAVNNSTLLSCRVPVKTNEPPMPAPCTSTASGMEVSDTGNSVFAYYGHVTATTPLTRGYDIWKLRRGQDFIPRSFATATFAPTFRFGCTTFVEIRGWSKPKCDACGATSRISFRCRIILGLVYRVEAETMGTLVFREQISKRWKGWNNLRDISRANAARGLCFHEDIQYPINSR